MTNALHIFSEPFVERIGWALVHFFWQGAAIAAGLAVVLWILRQRSPQARYFAAWAALLLMSVCLPVTAWLVTIAPAPEMAAEKPSAARDLQQAGPATLETASVNKDTLPATLTGRTIPEPNIDVAHPTSQKKAVSSKEKTSPALSTVKPEKSPAKAEWSWASLTKSLKPTLPWIVGVWLSGALVLAAWHLAGYRHLIRLKQRSTTPVPSAIEQALHRLAAQLGIRQNLRALLSPLVEVPTVLGWLRPVILLPLAILGEMPPEQLEMILAHELAHIRRRDYPWNLLQIAIETLLFYHPAVWWVSRRIREERENCCDREAVAVLGNPLAYANALLRLAEIRCQRQASAAPAASIAADGGSLESRIRRVLGLPVRSSSASPAWLGGVLAVLLLAAIFSVSIAWAGGQQAAGEKNPPSPEKAAAAPVSMTAAEFAKLSDAQQRDVLAKAFQQRLDLSKNISYEANEILHSYENNNGEPGKLLKKPPVLRCNYHYWRLGDSYKFVDWSYKNVEDAKPLRCSTCGVNAEERIARNTSTCEDEKYPPHGQVQYPFETSSFGNYLFWLDGMPDLDYWRHDRQMEEHLFQYLLERAKQWEIEIPKPGDKVQLSVPWQPWGDKPGGNRVYQLDPQKGFLPVKCAGRFVVPAVDGRKEHWRIEDFVVEESREIGKVWMPVKLKTILHTSTMPEVIQIGEIQAVQLEAGKVKPADLIIPFTEGMHIQDVIEGVTYTADAQGNAAWPIKDDPNWKQEPPKGWSKGQVEEAYSLASRISAADRKRLTDEREAKSKPIDDALKVLKANPPATQEDRIEAALKILRVYRVGEREGDWATAIRELITIGKPAVPKLIEELDRTESDKGLRAMGFVLRGIGDPRAIPALIRAIPRLIQPPSSDFGTFIKGNRELSEFMQHHDNEYGKTAQPLMPNSGEVYFSYGRPIREIMPTLEKMTSQSFGWGKLNFASSKANGVLEQRRQKKLFLDLAQKWTDWWSQNWKDYVANEADAELERTQKSLALFADTIAQMPEPEPPTEIPCGPAVKVGDGSGHSQFKRFVNLDVGPEIPAPQELLKKSPQDNPSPELLAWAEKEGVDLLRIEIQRPGEEKTYYGYQPVGMKVWKIDNGRLKNLEKELQESKKLNLPPLWEGPISSVDQEGEMNEEHEATFLFITKQGTCGVLQIRSGLHHDFVPGSPVMGPSVFEYKVIYESEPEKTPPIKLSFVLPPAPVKDKVNSAPPANSQPLGNKGTVVDENGKPAGGAEIIVANVHTPASVVNGRAIKQRAPVCQADAEGRFPFNPPAGMLDALTEYHLIAVHERGYGDVSEEEEEFAKTGTIRLKPWGRVEGTVKIGSEAAKNLNVDFVLEHPAIPSKFLNRGDSMTTTDEQGRFVLERVMPGQGFVTRAIRAGRQTSWTNRTAVEVVSGQTAHAVLAQAAG